MPMRGHIQQRGNDSWRVKVFVGRDATGVRRYVERSVRGTRREAERELARVVVEVGEGRHAAAAPMTYGDVLDRWLDMKRRTVEVAVAGTRVIDLGWVSPPSAPWDRDFHSRRPQGLVRLVPIDGADAVVVPIPDIDEESARVGERFVWFLARAGAGLMGVDADTGATFEVPVSFDCTPHMPPAQLPAELDLEVFEAGELEELRSSLLGGWTSDRTSETRPFIRGVTFREIERRGSFPDTAIVALFTSVDRPGITFGRTWRLYDDLGNPESMEYADIGFMEDVESAACGLPPLEACTPDADASSGSDRSHQPTSRGRLWR
jgi:hypothetical protein